MADPKKVLQVMSQSSIEIDRRKFVGASLSSGVGLGAFLAGHANASSANVHPVARNVRLPRSGFQTPIIGVGCPYLARWIGQQRPQRAKDVLRYAFDQGFRFFDSGQLYEIDPLAGEAIAEFRDKVYISNKTHAAGPNAPELVRAHVEVALSNYKTDYIDCVKVHNAFHYDNSMRVLDALDTLRNEGKIRQIGISTHVYYELAYQLIDTGRVDEVMIAKGYFPKGYYQMLSERNREFRELAIGRAHELGMNIIGMKCLGGILFNRDGTRFVPDFEEEKMAKLPGAAIRWGFADPRITMYAIGMDQESDVDAALALISGDMTFTLEDRALLAEFSARLWESEFITKMEKPFTKSGEGYLEPYVAGLLRDQGIDPEPYRLEALNRAKGGGE